MAKSYTTPGKTLLNVGDTLSKQEFDTTPVRNDRPSLYTLVVRDSFSTIIQGYTFPISPENLRKEYSAMSNFYDVQSTGGSGEFGVQRIADLYGHAPVIYTIEGTTGFDRHSRDGYKTTGLESIQVLEELFKTYATLNATQSILGLASVYVMEFYDYFRREYWEVIPSGPQTIRQTRTRPTLVSYAFRFVGIRNLASAPVSEADALAQKLTTTASGSASILSDSLSKALLYYTSQTLQFGSNTPTFNFGTGGAF